MIYRQTPFAKALQAKSRQLNALKGVTLIYCTDTAEFPVIGRPGKTIFNQTDRHGIKVIEYRRDYVIPADQLVDPFTGRPFIPTDGHRIKEPTGPDRFTVHEVRPVGSEPAARYADTTETEWRIHTIRTEEEPTP